jgi:hypothetical protein
MDTPTSFGEALKYCDGSTYSDYVGTNAEPLYIEFCNFVQPL